MTTRTDNSIASPSVIMDPRRLGALQPNRMSASRSFINTMIRDGWTIVLDELTLDARGNGQAKYTVSGPAGAVTFLAFLREPIGGNRTSRIIGTSWDMVGSLIDGIATEEQIEQTAQELPKLYEGRAPHGTLMWFRSNQSLRIFQHVRQSLASGHQPDAMKIKRVGYLMRNTGLDGNGTFGSTSFKALPAGHLLEVPYFAQMLSAYLMRELSIDVVQELARHDSPENAVALTPDIKRFIGVGNGSALGLVMFVYNRPRLIHGYISAYADALTHVLRMPIEPRDTRFDQLERLLDRTISYRALEDTSYKVFTGSREIAADLRRVRGVVRAARRGDIAVRGNETLLAATHRLVHGTVSVDAEEAFNALLLELAPDYCDALVTSRLVVNEELDLDPRTTVGTVRSVLHERFSWTLDIPLNDPEYRDRVWYQSRAAEEPRSGPQDEVPGAHDVVLDYPGQARELARLLDGRESDEAIGVLLFDHPELEQLVRHMLALRDDVYGIPHADPHDGDFVPVWVIRLMNSFIHGLDRTEDHLGRIIRGLIFEGAPFRDELDGADGSAWWWSYRSVTGHRQPEAREPAPEGSAKEESPANVTLEPIQSATVAPRFDENARLLLKLREARLIGGRAMQALGVPAGSWHGAREFWIAALLASPDAIAAFGRVLAGLSSHQWTAPTQTLSVGDARGIELDLHGESLLVTGHIVVNMLAAVATDDGTRVTLVDVQADNALEGLSLALGRYGVDASVVNMTESSVVIDVRTGLDGGAERYADALGRMITDGIDLPAQTWWDVYFPSNAALYTDTPISRQHTGASVADVHLPGQNLTKQFAAEELVGLFDPDDADNQDTAFFTGVQTS